MWQRGLSYGQCTVFSCPCDCLGATSPPLRSPAVLPRLYHLSASMEPLVPIGADHLSPKAVICIIDLAVLYGLFSIVVRNDKCQIMCLQHSQTSKNSVDLTADDCSLQLYPNLQCLNWRSKRRRHGRVQSSSRDGARNTNDLIMQKLELINMLMHKV